MILRERIDTGMKIKKEKGKKKKKNTDKSFIQE